MQANSMYQYLITNAIFIRCSVSHKYKHFSHKKSWDQYFKVSDFDVYVLCKGALVKPMLAQSSAVRMI